MDSKRAIKIKVALLQIGKTQSEIARELKVTPASVNDVISGRRTSHRIMTYIENVIKQSAAKCL